MNYIEKFQNGGSQSLVDNTRVATRIPVTSITKGNSYIADDYKPQYNGTTGIPNTVLGIHVSDDKMRTLLNNKDYTTLGMTVNGKDTTFYKAKKSGIRMDPENYETVRKEDVGYKTLQKLFDIVKYNNQNTQTPYNKTRFERKTYDFVNGNPVEKREIFAQNNNGGDFYLIPDSTSYTPVKQLNEKAYQHTELKGGVPENVKRNKSVLLFSRKKGGTIDYLNNF